jgi:hypothetical protein
LRTRPLAGPALHPPGSHSRWTEERGPPNRAASLHEVEKLAAGEIMFSFVNRYKAKDGSYRSLAWNAMVPSDERLMYASARDVTESLEMESVARGRAALPDGV